MVQHIPIRFSDSAEAAAKRDPDSLASSDRYTREGLLERSPEAPADRSAQTPEAAESPQAPSTEEPAELRKQLDRVTRQCRGIAADLENYKRHAEKELASARHDVEAELLAELGDVVRSLELALESADQDVDSVRDGMQMVARRLSKVYKSHGLERISTVGYSFDPALHEAVVVEPSSDADKGTIINELSPGFKSGERVIRPAKVSVAG